MPVFSRVALNHCFKTMNWMISAAVAIPPAVSGARGMPGPSRRLCEGLPWMAVNGLLGGRGGQLQMSIGPTRSTSLVVPDPATRLVGQYIVHPHTIVRHREPPCARSIFEAHGETAIF